MFETLEEIKGKTFQFRNIDPNKWLKIRRYDNTSDDVGPGLDKNGLPVTGLTEDYTKTNAKGNKEVVKGTRKLIEEAQGLKEGDLKKGALHDPSPFWTQFYIPMDDKEVTLSGDDPQDQLKILFLAAQSNVAVGMKNRKSKTEYLLYTKEDAAKEKNTKKKVKRTAYVEFEKLTLEEKIEILEMLGTKAKALPADIVEDKLSDMLEDNPSKFLAIIKDPKRPQKTFVRKCLDLGILSLEDGNVVYGETVLGYDFNSSVDSLFSDEHAKTREALKAQIGR